MTEPNEFLHNLKQEIPYHSQIGKICAICEESFTIYNLLDERKICDECRHRLKKLLYPN